VLFENSFGKKLLKLVRLTDLTPDTEFKSVSGIFIEIGMKSCALLVSAPSELLLISVIRREQIRMVTQSSDGFFRN
jgi:hypothetical protein